MAYCCALRLTSYKCPFQLRQMLTWYNAKRVVCIVKVSIRKNLLAWCGSSRTVFTYHHTSHHLLSTSTCFVVGLIADSWHVLDQDAFTSCKSSKPADPKHVLPLFPPFSSISTEWPFTYLLYLFFIFSPFSSLHCLALNRFGPVSDDSAVADWIKKICKNKNYVYM